MEKNIEEAAPTRLASGVDGVDDILGGGLTPHRMYLIEGAPGAGKTTFALQFLLKGAESDEVGLYITLSETKRRFQKDMKGAVNFMDMLLTLAI